MVWRKSDRVKNPVLCRASQPAVQVMAERLENRLLPAGIALGTPVQTQISSGVFPVSTTAIGDLNGDGIPDLVAGRNNLQAQVYLGTKTGAFTLGPIYAAGGNFIALGDFNNDGKLDLATANGVYPGAGNGTFGTLITGFVRQVGTINMYAQDINGDGNLDLVCATYVAAAGTVTNPTPTLGFSVLLSNADGTFKPAVSTTIASQANLTQAQATLGFSDFTGDGILDCLTPIGLMIGKGDGTFSKPAALPYKGLAPGTAAIPFSPIFAIGDFNGDTNSDIATIPVRANSGQVEIFIGDGKGVFTDAGPITVATTVTITALDADFLTDSGNTDLIAGISSSPGTQTGTAAIDVLANNGNAIFAAPTQYAVSGPPVSFAVTDFNADNNPDLLSIDGIAGSTTSTGLPLAATAAVLLNTKAALIAPVMTLKSSANPAITGNSVTYTVTAKAPATSAVDAAVPTGVMTFFNGTNVIGTANLVAGKASITVAVTGVGVQQVTANYGGDGVYSSLTTPALLQTVLATGAKVPLLVPALASPNTLPAVFITGDAGNVAVTLTNGGGAAANGTVAINFYLSTSGAIDSSAIGISVPALKKHRVHLGVGKTATVTARLTLHSYPAANYFLVAQIVPVANLTADEVSSTPIVSTTTFRAAGLIFGSLGTHHGIKLKAADASGKSATFSLTGPGTGTISQTNGTTSLALAGTTTSSHLTISSPAGFTLDNAAVASVLNSFSAGRTTLAGAMNLSGGVMQLALAGTGSTDNAATIHVGVGAFKPMLSFGKVAGLAVTSDGALQGITAKSWQSGSIDATSITNLSITGNFAADVRLHAGGRLKSARIGSITAGIWAVAGGIATLHLVGNISGAKIYAGADAGPDNVLGTSDDSFVGTTIDTLFIGGTDNSLLIAAGVAALAGGTINAGIMLLPHGAISAITLRGTVSDDSRFLATFLPKTVALNGTKVSSATDPHFQI